MTDWTDAELFEAWEERAAIIEHDGRTSRQHANYLAAKDEDDEICLHNSEPQIDHLAIPITECEKDNLIL